MCLISTEKPNGKFDINNGKFVEFHLTCKQISLSKRDARQGYDDPVYISENSRYNSKNVPEVRYDLCYNGCRSPYRYCSGIRDSFSSMLCICAQSDAKCISIKIVSKQISSRRIFSYSAAPVKSFKFIELSIEFI